MPRTSQTSFTAGEIAPELYGRVDLARYSFFSELVLEQTGRVSGGTLAAALTTMHLGNATMAEQPLPARIRRCNNTLYLSSCPDCGEQSYRAKGDIGRRCTKCAGHNREKHGLHKHPLYTVHRNMLNRCYMEACPLYRWYGRRGIAVCDEWKGSFPSFYAWAMASGWQKGLQLDRRDNDGPYSPTNCRFVTRIDNIRNMGTIVLSKELVGIIKRMLLDGHKPAQIGRALGVSLRNVCNVKSGANWADVPPAEEV